MWQYSSSLMCFLNGLLLGNDKDLASWAKTQWSFTFTRPQAFCMALSVDGYTKHLQKTGASQHPSHISNKYTSKIWMYGKFFRFGWFQEACPIF